MKIFRWITVALYLLCTCAMSGAVYVNVVVDTNGVLLFPTNLFQINSNLLGSVVVPATITPSTTNQWRVDATNAANAATNGTVLRTASLSAALTPDLLPPGLASSNYVGTFTGDGASLSNVSGVLTDGVTNQWRVDATNAANAATNGTVLRAASVLVGVTNQWMTDATNAANAATNGTVANSAALGGTAASGWALKTDATNAVNAGTNGTVANSAALGGTAAASWALKTDATNAVTAGTNGTVANSALLGGLPITSFVQTNEVSPLDTDGVVTNAIRSLSITGNGAGLTNLPWSSLTKIGTFSLSSNIVIKSSANAPAANISITNDQQFAIALQMTNNIANGGSAWLGHYANPGYGARGAVFLSGSSNTPNSEVFFNFMGTDIRTIIRVPYTDGFIGFFANANRYGYMDGSGTWVFGPTLIADASLDDQAVYVQRSLYVSNSITVYGGAITNGRSIWLDATNVLPPADALHVWMATDTNAPDKIFIGNGGSWTTIP